MRNGQLDVYDSLMIRNIKSNNTTIGIMRRIWAKRCGIELEWVSNEIIFLHLLDLIERLELCGLVRFHEKANEYKRMMDVCKEKESDDTVTMIRVCCSILRFTEAKRLPGYAVPSKFKDAPLGEVAP
jgi:hypothetical protein